MNLIVQKSLSNSETNSYSHHRGPSQLKLILFLAFWGAQNAGRNEAVDMLPTACFSALPTFVNSSALLPQTFLKLSSLHMTLHSKFRSYKVSHHPLRYSYRISVKMTHYAAIAHQVRVWAHTPICLSQPLQLLNICTNTNSSDPKHLVCVTNLDFRNPVLEHNISTSPL